MTIEAESEELKTASEFTDTAALYDFIIDRTCGRLDALFRKNNYCDFRDGACAFARAANPNTKSKKGCCTSYKLRRVLTVDFMYDHKTCEYLGARDGSSAVGCVQKCISCKLFCCSYLRKKGVNFHAEDFTLLTSFLNPMQLRAVNVNLFQPKERIVKKLLQLKNNKMPYLWFLFTGGHFIRK